MTAHASSNASSSDMEEMEPATPKILGCAQQCITGFQCDWQCPGCRHDLGGHGSCPLGSHEWQECLRGHTHGRIGQKNRGPPHENNDAEGQSSAQDRPGNPV